MYILGVSGLYHDSAAALIKDGKIVAAAQEERFTRKKHDNSVPVHAIRYCLEEEGIGQSELESVVYYDNPILTLERFAANLKYAGKDADDLINLSFDSLIEKKMWIHKLLKDAVGGLGSRKKLFVTEHHIAHAASAFYPSPYERAAIVTMDGVGEWATTTIGFGEGNKIKLIEEINYPHSLGLLYSAFTYFCGFKVNSGDYKLMGLAPYGEPVYYQLIKDKLIDIKEDGSYRLHLEYFDFQYGRAMTNAKFADLFGGEARKPEAKITKREMDMAASVQRIVEEVLILTAKHAKTIVGDDVDNLVLAGGVALNCVANGKLLKENIFKNIWIQPAAGDAGGAAGAALYFYYQYENHKRNCDNRHDEQSGSYLGPAYSSEEIEEYLVKNHYPYVKIENKEELYDQVATLIMEQNVIGLMQGRMEYGPRALGNRSIIADARSSQMQSKLNLKIKYRESFRPFAPSVLEERVEDYFDLNAESPYMLLCADVMEEIKKTFRLAVEEKNGDLLSIVNMVRSEIPAVTHVDYSARIQTVNQRSNPMYYGIINALNQKCGCGVIINTSFNVRGEPIVCDYKDAYLCFMRTEMDVLVLENMILFKNNQPALDEETDWRDMYELD